MPLVEVKDLIKRYGEVEALRGVSFTVEAGEVFGLLGPNGAGKTTLMRILAGLTPPSSGTARIGGYDVIAERVRAQQHIGYCPQDLLIYEDLTGRENLLFFAALRGIPRSEACRRADEVLKFLGLAEWGDQLVKKYSGGMKRRLNLAAALVHDPDVLLLDEPTVGFDPHARHELWNLLRQLRREGRAILLATHYMEEADALCDRVAIIDQGRIVALDTPEALKRQYGPPAVLAFLLATEISDPLIDIAREFSEEGKVLVCGEELRIYVRNPEAILPTATQRLIEAGARIREVRVAEPTLEDVFVRLTGRRLEE